MSLTYRLHILYDAIYGEKGIVSQNHLEELLQVPDKDCWLDQIKQQNQTIFLIILRTFKANPLVYTTFDNPGARHQFMRDRKLIPVNDKLDKKNSGQFDCNWIHNNVHTEYLQRILDAGNQLKKNQYDYGIVRAQGGTNVYWLVGKIEEEPDVHYFVHPNRLYQFLTPAYTHAKNLVEESQFLFDRAHMATFLKQDCLLKYVLTQVNDCWDEQIEWHGKRIHILYRRTADEIEITYPDNLEMAKCGLYDKRQAIHETGEYPTELGEYLNRTCKIIPDSKINHRSMKMLPNEYWAWVSDVDTGFSNYPNLFLVQICDQDGNFSIRYFTTQESQRKALAKIKLTNAFLRDQSIKDLAWKFSKSIHSDKGYVFAVPYPTYQKAALITIPATGEDVQSEYVPLGQMKSKQAQTGLVNLNEAVKGLVSFSKDSVWALDRVEKQTLEHYFGKPIDQERNTYRLIKRYGYTLLICIDKDNRPYRLYFPTKQSAYQYIERLCENEPYSLVF